MRLCWRWSQPESHKGSKDGNAAQRPLLSRPNYTRIVDCFFQLAFSGLCSLKLQVPASGFGIRFVHSAAMYGLGTKATGLPRSGAVGGQHDM